MYYQIVLLSSIIFLLVFIHIYVTLYLLKTNDDVDDITASTNEYLCPQYPTSKGYIHVDFTDNFSLNYSKICKSDDILLIYIISKAEHIERRKRIRRTWANKNRYGQLLQTCFIFLIGYQTNYSQSIRSEARIYNDIIQLNIDETYQNIIYKEIGALKWSQIYASHVPYLFKTDDDIIVDTLLLSDIVKYFLDSNIDHSDYIQRHEDVQNFISEITMDNRYNLFRGIYLNGYKTIRRGKFALNNIAWNSDYLPAYCSGVGYIFSSFIRDRLYRASLCYAMENIPWMSDLFISGFLATAAAVHCSPWSIGYIQSHKGCSLSFQNQPRLLLCSTSMHIGRLNMDDYDQAWTAILDRHLLTNETIDEERKKYIRLLKIQAQEKLPIEQSIIEQIENDSIAQNESIVPLSKMAVKLD
ncbi:unnamed protein product [Adineta steineri]|uniref:Hexosyltransferase n=1 Tax=Adineta steineri TaxID=433720 RepID=A0A814ISR9_9BILA|nr:unnamed protein product [Adineta steineri]